MGRVWSTVTAESATRLLAGDDVDTSPVGLARVALDGRILEANDALARLTRRSRADLVGLPAEQLSHPDDRPRHRALATDLVGGRRDSAQLDTRLVDAAGTVSWIWAALGVVRGADGRARHLVVHVVDASDRHAEAQSWRTLAATDPLTGLTNRRGAEEALHRLRPGDAVVLLDLDHFKRLNDEEGHAAGDDALRRFAVALRSVCRMGDTAVRWGGEEFLLLLPSAGTVGARAWVERLRREWAGTRQGAPTFSAGICITGAGVRDPVALADRALYTAKEAGRDTTRLHEHGDHGADIDWPVVLRAALDDPGCPTVAFQPVVDLQRGVIAGYEALARFPPDVPATTQAWFDAADRQSVGVTLQLRAVRAAVARLSELPDNCFLAVNIDPRVLAAPGAVDAFGGAQERLDRIVVELTGPAPPDDDGALLTALALLRDRGARTALDEAGSGDAGLAYLARLRPDLVKLDRALIVGCDTDPARLGLVELLGAHAGRLDAWLVAEGIETEGELEALVRLGVPLAQGYLLGRPTEDWPLLSEVAADRLRALSLERSSGGRLFRLLEPTTVCADDAAVAAVLAAADGGTPGWIVRLDPAGHAHTVLAPDGRSTRVTLQAHDDEEPAAVALRAVGRAFGARLDPLVVSGPNGAVLGVLSAAGLLAHLASPGLGATQALRGGKIAGAPPDPDERSTP
jgi:diguanylate cyclase (GGDEF)-like protein/PAS domain S-box-containing protein